MTTMIEKMARAELAEDPFRNSEGEEIAWEDLEPHSRNMCCRRARAALTTLLEPSEAMVRVGTFSLEFDGVGGMLGGAKEAIDRSFAAMIQAALDGKDTL